MSEDPKPLNQIEGNGWRWGQAGKVYYGPDAKDRAVRQGLAILRTRKGIKEEENTYLSYEGSVNG